MTTAREPKGDGDEHGGRPHERRVLDFWSALEALSPPSHADKKLGVAIPDRSRKSGVPPARAPVKTEFLKSAMPLPWCDPDRLIENLFARPEEAKGKTMRWRVPLMLADMACSTETIARCFDELAACRMDEDDVRERWREPGEGWATLAVASIDAAGLLVPGSVEISRFGRACGLVFGGEFDALPRASDELADIASAVERELTPQEADGRRRTVLADDLQGARKRLRERLGLGGAAAQKAFGLALPTHVIQEVSGLERALDDRPDMLDSFHARSIDEAHATLETLPPDSALAAYLRDAPAARAWRDPLADRGTLEEILHPSRMPLGRWPAPDPVRLMTLQQAAINALFDSVPERGLFAVNGPPGTGKTTLLRDVIAEVVVRRAHALVAFERPSDAFSGGTTISASGFTSTLYELHPSLRHHGVIVAAQNNPAVENISLELPANEAIRRRDGVPVLEHFHQIAQELSHSRKTWGLFAAKLGRASNCREFAQRLWWGRESGESPTLRHRLNRSPRRAPAEGEGSARYEGPADQGEAEERWRVARGAFDEAIAQAERRRAENKNILELAREYEALEKRCMDASAGLARADERVQQRDERCFTLAARVSRLERQDRRRELYLDTFMTRSRWSQRLFSRRWRRHRAWLAHSRRRDEERLARRRLERESAVQEHGEARRSRERDALVVADCEHALDNARNAREALARSGAAPVYDGSADHAARHAAAPWSDEKSLRVREEVFITAMGVHEAFIDAAGSRVIGNLNAIVRHVQGMSVSSDAAHLLGDLWDSLFLVTPLVSTTFAAATRLLRGLSPESIGWLVVDEAGQACPQAAVGCLAAARRAIMIGDPLQIEPIEAVPEGQRRAIANACGIDAERWAGHWSSCQVLSDRASPWRSRLGDRDIGFPLLVHRRCAEPMFSIANAIAYEGLMLQAADPGASPLLDALGPQVTRSSWLHVPSTSVKFSEEEADVAAKILHAALGASGCLPDLYFITPFRDIAAPLRLTLLKVLLTTRPDLDRGSARKWARDNIGTIHTFQGKEAEAVCLVLGSSAARSGGSRHWAGRTPNVLNVAVTRARRLLLVIGNHDAWSNVGVFTTAAYHLPRVDPPFDGTFTPVTGRLREIDSA